MSTTFLIPKKKVPLKIENELLNAKIDELEKELGALHEDYFNQIQLRKTLEAKLADLKRRLLRAEGTPSGIKYWQDKYDQLARGLEDVALGIASARKLHCMECGHDWIGVVNNKATEGVCPSCNKRVCIYCGFEKGNQKCMGNDDCPDNAFTCKTWGDMCCKCGASYAKGQV